MKKCSFFIDKNFKKSWGSATQASRSNKVKASTKEEAERVGKYMIRKVYELDPLVCPKCQGQMRIITFLTDYHVVDRILNHLKLAFVADKPPPPRFTFQEVLMAAEASGECLS